MYCRLILLIILIGNLKFAEAQNTILIKNVNIIDVEKGVLLKNSYVLIKDSTITKIAKKNKPKIKADKVIDGSGRFLIPGLWDMHTHTWSDATTFPLLIANGITGIRGMFEDIKNVNNWRSNISSGKNPGPQIFAAGPIVDGPKPVWPSSVAVSDEAGGRRAVDSLKNILKTDFIKVYSLLSRESYFAIAEECKKLGIDFSGHVPNHVTVLEAANAGQKSQEHLYGMIEIASDSTDHWYSFQQGKIKDSSFTKRYQRKEFLLRTYNEKKLISALAEISKTDTWICPTLTVNYGISHVNDTSLLDHPNMQYMGDFIKNFWDYRKDFRFKTWTDSDFEQSRREFGLKLKIVKRIHEAGIPIIAGTDYPNPHCYIGFGIHDELQWLVKAGLSAAEALKTATMNPAVFFKLSDTQGTITQGKIANLVLLNKNPLEDISNSRSIEMVVVKGKLYDAAQLKQMLESVKKLVGN